MQPWLLTREKYTFHRKIKLHLPHCFIPSDIATHLASTHPHCREGRSEREERGRERPEREREKGNYINLLF